ncbi:hypothetical protein ABH920_001537 [Catenulispora sp. EB89]|jgi:hypothetical protein|uniref:hypothetical protein n=1 Tax=unclassified Catenulispora TaxID=414885 RepID=UPI003512D706
MRDTVSRAQEASASGSHRSHGGPAGPSAVAAPHEDGRDADVFRATVQPAHRVRGWLAAAPR